MLVVSRRELQRIRIGTDIIVTVVRISDNKVRIGIDAPKHIPILREELSPFDSERSPVQISDAA